MRLHYREKLGIPKRSNLEPAASVAERDGRPTEREVATLRRLVRARASHQS